MLLLLLFPDSAVDMVVVKEAAEEEDGGLGRDNKIRWGGRGWCDNDDEDCDDVLDVLVVEVTDDGDTSLPLCCSTLRPLWYAVVLVFPRPLDLGLPGLPVASPCPSEALDC